MFRLLRYFSIASLMSVMLAAAVLGGIYRQVATSHMLELGESSNVTLTQTLANSLWPQLHDFVNAAGRLDAEALRHHPGLASLRQRVIDQMHDTRVVRVKLYDLNGRTLFSTDAAQIGEDKSRNAGFLSARQGRPISEIIHRSQFSAFEQVIENRDMLSSYVALRRGNQGPVEGVLEVYTDVTEVLRSIDKGQRQVTLSVIAVLTLLYGMLFFIVRHADTVIKSQYAQQHRTEQALRESQEHLDRRVRERTAELEVTNRTLEMEVLERKHAEQRIQYMAYHDALTGLPNRILLEDRIKQSLAWADRRGIRLAVAFIDLDHFKNINDSLGHHIGDQVLQVLAQRLSLCLREGDTIARIGGDEFVVSLPDVVPYADLSQMARNLLDSIALRIDIAGHELHLTASIGIAFYPEHGQDVTTLMRNADTAMYSAKQLGRNQHKIFAEHMNTQIQQRLSMERDMRHALDDGGFVLHYQPIVDIESGAIVGAEALLRWPNTHKDWIAPAEFIPVAEESGLIAPLGVWVLEQACRQLRAWRELGLRDFTLAVNLSSRHFMTEGLAATVASMIQRTEINPACLHLEITESLLMSQSETILANFDGLGRLGIRFSIDDFGTGYSSLGFLKRFPIHLLKLDRSFIHDLPDNADSVAIVTAVIAMAKSLDMIVVAEGVETNAQLAFLKQLGCDRMQGFLFSQPAPAAEFIKLALEQRETSAAE
jgi:diguanylate cyclase (GGDEF)-like protein